jgi:beta-glucosidase
VGVAHHLRIIEPHDPSRRRDRMAAKLQDTFFNEGFAGAMVRGRASGPLHKLAERLAGFSSSEAVGTQDFFGLNYYSRDLVRFDATKPGEAFMVREVKAGAEVSDLGWEIYPAGLTELVCKWHERSGVPVIITENGISTSDDGQRSRFLVRHLRAVHEAIERGADVRGYMHWSLMDNFEWAEGYTSRFGLVEVDYETQVRRPRQSAQLYARMAASGGVDDDILEEWGDA